MDQPSSADESGITLRIKFKSESIDQFIARYGGDVSPGGIFIRTRDPLGVGTNLRFEFSLADSQPLLVGQGTVVWVREPDQARAGVVPGMGVRFDQLTGHSQSVLGTILAGKARRGEGSGAARLSASLPVVTNAAAPGSERNRRPSGEVATAASSAVTSETLSTADPWQSDKTEIASMPPSFMGGESPRTSEELSLSGAEPIDVKPGPVAPPPRSPAPPLVEIAARSPHPVLGMANRDAAGNVTSQVRRGTPHIGVPSPGSTPRLPTPVGGAVVPRGASPSGSVAPVSSPEDATTDPFNRELPSAPTSIQPPARAKMLVIIAIAAAASAAAGFFIIQRRLATQSPVVVVAPALPEPAPTPPAAEPAPRPAPAAPSHAAAPTPPAPAHLEPTPAAAPPSSAPPERLPPPTAVARPAKPAAKASRGSRPGRHAAPVAATTPASTPSSAPPAPSDEAAAAPPAAESAGTEEFWLKVRSTPSGAEVLIDGQVEGKTPFQRRLLDTTRPYALTVRKPGYESHEQMLSASDEWVKKGNQRTLTIAPKLTKAKGGESASEPAAGEKAPAESAPAGEKAAEPAPVENPAP